MARAGRSFPSRPQSQATRNRNYKQQYNLVATYPNELGVTTDWAITTTGGTVTEVTTRFHDGAQSLRINRTSNARIDATANSPWGASRINSGEFWIWVASLPTAQTPIFHAVLAVGNNFEIELNASGQLMAGQQGGTNVSAASGTLITTGAWYKISFWLDTSSGTVTGRVAVNNDTPVAVTWAQAAEQPAEWVFGARLTGGTALSDIYYDEGYAYTGWIPNPAITFPTTPVLDDFNRANVGPPPSANWTADIAALGDAGYKVVSNQMIESATGPTQWSSWWNAASFGNDQEVYLTLGSGGVSPFELWLRMSNIGTGGLTGYSVHFDATTFFLYRWNAGSSTALTGSISHSLVAGSKVGLEIIGSRLSCYIAAPGGPWVRMATATDTTYATGTRIGLLSQASALTFDDFGGGTMVTAGSFSLPAVTSSGTSSVSANNIKIRLPNRTSAGTGTATANNIKIRLPSRTSVGTGTASAQALRIRLPSRTSAGVGSVSANNIRIRLPARDTLIIPQLVFNHGTTTSAVGSTTLDFTTAQAVLSHNYLIVSAVSADPAGTFDSVAVQSGVDPGNIVWQILYIPSTTGLVGLAIGLCPTGVNSGVTFRATWSTSTTARLIGLSEWAGLDPDPNSVLEDGQVNVGTTGDPSVTVTALTANTMIMGIMVNGNATTATPNAGFTELHDANAGSRTLNTIYRAGPTATTYTPGADMATNSSWGIIGVVYHKGTNSNAVALDLNLSGGGSFSLPVESSAGASTATATALRIRLPSRTSAGVATATATALKIRLPNRTSAGVATASANNVKIRLPSRTSAGVGTATATGLRDRLPNVTSAGTSGATATGLRIRLPNRTSAGTATATATALRSRLPNVTSAGVGALTTSGLRIRLPNRTSVGTSNADETALNLAGGGGFAIPAETSDGTSTATAQALRIRLPNRTSAGAGTATATAFRVRFPQGASAGTGGATATGLRIRLPSRTSASTSTATATALKVRLPSRTSAGVAAVAANNLKIRLPNRTSIGTSTATATALRIRLSNATSAGVGAVAANNIKIRLPSRTSAGTSTAFAIGIIGGGTGFTLPAVASNGSSSASAAGLRIRLPSRSSAGTGAASAPLRIRLPSVLTAGFGLQKPIVEAYFDTGNDSFTLTTISGSTGTLAQSTTQVWQGTNSHKLDGTVPAVSSFVGGRRLLSGQLTPFSLYRLNARVFIESITAGCFTVAQVFVTHGGTGTVQQFPGATINRATVGSWQFCSTTFFTSSNPNALGPYTEWRFSNASGVPGSVIAYIDDYHLDLLSSVQPLQIKLPNRTSGGTSNAVAQALSTRLPARTSAGVGTAVASGLRIRLPARTSAGTSTATTAGLKDRIGQVSSAGTSNLTTSGLRIRLPSRTSSGTSNAIATFVVGALPLESSSGASNATATAFRIRLPARTSAGTSTTITGGLKDKIALVSSAGHSTATATGFRIRLPQRSASGSSTALTTGLRVRLPGRTASGTSSSTAAQLRLGLIVFANGDSDTFVQGFRIRLPHAMSSGTGGGFAGAFIYIPPPAKVVIASGSTHSLVASSTTHVLTGSRGGGTVTASSSRQVTTVGDLTKTVTAGP